MQKQIQGVTCTKSLYLDSHFILACPLSTIATFNKLALNQIVLAMSHTINFLDYIVIVQNNSKLANMVISLDIPNSTFLSFICTSRYSTLM